MGPAGRHARIGRRGQRHFGRAPGFFQCRRLRHPDRRRHLPHPGLEQIIETYYRLPVYTWQVTFDYQFVVNPAYNRDRGPVSVLGVRAQTEF